MLSFRLLLRREPCKKSSVGGGWWWLIHNEFSVLLCPKLWTRDLDQAEQLLEKVDNTLNIMVDTNIDEDVGPLTFNCLSSAAQNFKLLNYLKIF